MWDIIPRTGVIVMYPLITGHSGPVRWFLNMVGCDGCMWEAAPQEPKQKPAKTLVFFPEICQN